MKAAINGQNTETTNTGAEEAAAVAGAVIAAEFKATDNPTSALVLSAKPPVTIARGAPRVSPVSVIVIAAVPVAAPPVVRTIEVFVAIAGVEVAVRVVTVLAMEATDPKK